MKTKSFSIATTGAACFLLALTDAAPVQIATDANNVRTITAPGYQAIVAADGCLTNLRIDGQEFLKPGVSISRGSYFHQAGALKLPEITQPSDNTLVASSDKAEIRYEFASHAMTWTIVNKTDKGMSFFLIFDPSVVTSVMNDKGDTARPAVANNWQKTIWFAGKSRLEISGSTKLWGPWAGPYQVWEAWLQPNQTRTIEFKIGQASEAETAKLAKPTAPAPAPAPVAAPAKPPQEKPPIGPTTGTVLENDIQNLLFKIARDADPKRPLTYNISVLTEVFLNGKPAKLDAIRKGMKVTVTSSDGKAADRVDATD